MKRSCQIDYLSCVNRPIGFGVFLAVLTLTGCKSPQTTAADSTAPPAASTPATSAAPAPPAMVIPEKTVLEARIDQTLSTENNQAGDRFVASLALPVDIGGREVLPRGTRLRGHVTTSRSSGRLEGRATIGITLDAIEYNGQTIPITTTLDTKSSEAHKKRNIELIGVGSALGAVIGAIAGGGKGAAIGAVAGAGAGTAGAAATGKKQVVIPAETVFTFRLKSPVELR